MKLNDLKHNHSLTDLLKVIIFSIIMLMPFLAIATRCLYVVCNKNAYQSYSEKVNTTTSKISDGGTLRTGLMYQLAWNGKNSNYSVSNQSIGVLKGQSNIRETIWPNENWTLTQFNFTYEGNRARLICYDTSNTQHNYFDYFNTYGNTPMYFVPNNDYTFTNNSNQYINYYSTTYTTGNLDNVFEYSIDQVTQSNLFNWTQNTGIYTGINTMTTQLGIVGVFIPMLLTYWFLLTVIYIIIDIVLKTFTVISHMLIKKAE